MVVVCIMLFENKATVSKEFNVSDYQYYIDNFSSNEILGTIVDSEDVIKKAETTWIKVYGKSVKSQRPYQVFYDENNKVWLIRGSFKSNKRKGGVANIIIQNDSGKVLAIWHDE